MIINRTWAMPNKWTFKIKPIKEILEKYDVGIGWVDPFAGDNSPAEFTNDLNPKRKAKEHKEAIDFCSELNNYPIYEGVLFDPPYSGRQVKECYSELGIPISTNHTNSNFYWKVKREMAPRIRIGGKAICCGWNSNGFGKKYGFELIEVLLVAHGSSHNDTIVTVERKLFNK
jgi:hypothetical protein